MTGSVIGRGETGRGRMAGRLAGALALCGMALGVGSAPAVAADYAGGAGTVDGGVACSIGQPFWVPTGPTAETLPWPSVYYGHFSGGRPYIDAYGRTIVDWVDEHVCFPTSGQCRAWVHGFYRTHHQPEGYRGCLLLR